MVSKQLKITDLPVKPVDSTSPIPLYYQVEADLRLLLNSSHVAPGDLLPTEIELAEAYNVGRHTIRTALGRLATDRLITRKAGHGTVIKGQEDRQHFSLARSFTGQMEELGLQPHSEVLRQEAATVQPGDPRPLQSKIGAPCLLLDRLRYGGDEPLGLQYTIIITERCPNLVEYDFGANSLYEVLAHDYQLVITEITHTISAIVADKKQADLLKVEYGAPLLVVNTSSFLANREIIEFSASFYRADKYEYTTTQTSG